MPDYGKAGLYGIGTPQANPTVEAEFRILLPESAMMAVTRLTSSASDPIERLHAYIEDLDTFLDGFDTMTLDVFGLACTASSYLVGAKREAEIVKQETFAPILYVMPYDNLQDVMVLHNEVAQGLSSAIFTTDIREAEYFKKTSDCGITNVNIGTTI